MTIPKKTDKEKALFASYPEVKEIYKDSQGKYWVSKDTAKAQCKGGVKVQVIKK